MFGKQNISLKELEPLVNAKVFLVFKIEPRVCIDVDVKVRLVPTRLTKITKDSLIKEEVAIFEGNCAIRPENIIRLVHRAQDGNKIIFSRGYNDSPREDVQQVMEKLKERRGQEVQVDYVRDGKWKSQRGILAEIEDYEHIKLEDGTLVQFLAPGEALIGIDFIELSDDERYPWHYGCYSVSDELVPYVFKITNIDFVEELKKALFYLCEGGISVSNFNYMGRPEKQEPRIICLEPEEVW